jgi:hypothetical protein
VSDPHIERGQAATKRRAPQLDGGLRSPMIFFSARQKAHPMFR